MPTYKKDKISETCCCYLINIVIYRGERNAKILSMAISNKEIH